MKEQLKKAIKEKMKRARAEIDKMWNMSPSKKLSVKSDKEERKPELKIKIGKYSTLTKNPKEPTADQWKKWYGYESNKEKFIKNSEK